MGGETKKWDWTQAHFASGDRVRFHPVRWAGFDQSKPVAAKVVGIVKNRHGRVCYEIVFRKPLTRRGKVVKGLQAQLEDLISGEVRHVPGTTEIELCQKSTEAERNTK